MTIMLLSAFEPRTPLVGSEILPIGEAFAQLPAVRSDRADATKQYSGRHAWEFSNGVLTAADGFPFAL